ncbi:MAG TPA: hypothetical protein GX719_09885 [Gammaproteobacteria bacterium]|nr:hypothetical protein [Gammaproteobacteria bacterium]
MREPFSQADVKNTIVTGAGQSLASGVSLLKRLTLCAALLIANIYSLPVMAKSEGVAAPAYSIESAAATSNLLLDVVRAGQRLVAVGDRGHILYSDDEGQQWLQARVPTQQLLTAVYFVDERYGWAVGHDALILATRDGGATWTRQYDDVEQESPLLGIWFKDRDNGFAVGAYGMLLGTDNGGKDWESLDDKLDNEDGYHLNAIDFVSDAGIFIVGEMGVMFRSADWGESWETLDGPYEGSLFGIVPGQQADNLLVYGLRGHIFLSTDFGESWTAVPVDTDSGQLQFGLASGSLLSNGDVLIVGHGGTILRSTDGGQSFTITNRADRISLTGIAEGAAGGLVLVGQNGIHKTDAHGHDLAR